MQWLLDLADSRRSEIRTGSFFRRLGETHGDTADLQWVHRWAPQLLHQSREFTQSLCLRYASCRDPDFLDVTRDHASEEIDHPAQLMSWMSAHGIQPDGQPTQATIDNLALCWRSALRDPNDVQVATLNIVSEGVALDFYTAVIPFLERLGLSSGRYWKVHREVDSHHLMMGLDKIPASEPNSPGWIRVMQAVNQSALAYQRMLDSWVS